MKVAFHTPSLHVGGAEYWIHTLAANFQQCEPVGCFLYSNSQAVAHFDQGMLARVREEMPVLFPGEPVDADVHLSWGLDGLPAIAANHDAPFVEVAHGSGEWDQQRRLLKNSCLGANHLVAVSEGAKKGFPELVQHLVTVLHNGVDPSRVKKRVGGDEFRQRLGIRSHQRVAMFLGRFDDVKGPQRLLDAMPHLSEEWVALYVGHGPREDALKGYADNIAPGRMAMIPPIQDIGDALAAATCLVMPSESEGMPLGMIEAWMAQCPVVSAEHSWTREVEERHGPDMISSFPQVAEPEDIAAAIVRYDEVSVSTAYEAAMTNYTAAKMVSRWESYLLGSRLMH